jgi:glycosyltransferase involved in cell wall biosynthesis
MNGPDQAGRRVAVIIPALNEAPSIGRVLADVPAPFRERMIVVDNGSADGTPEAAAAAGAIVLHQPRRGYGAACLRGLEFLAPDPPDAVCFLDGDYSDHPEEMPRVVGPVLEGRADLVIGSRVLGSRERGALTPQTRFGNRLATLLIRVLHRARFTDLGPFRAVSWSALRRLRMADRDYGWTVEMQVKAARLGLRSIEVPVSYRRRIGKSKVSGTIRGSLGAGRKILWVIFRETARRGPGAVDDPGRPAGERPSGRFPPDLV